MIIKIKSTNITYRPGEDDISSYTKTVYFLGIPIITIRRENKKCRN